MKYLITILLFTLIATPVLAVDRPSMVRPRFWEVEKPIPPAPPPFPEIPEVPDIPDIPDIDIDIRVNSSDCITCSGGVTEVMTYPRARGQFWAKKGSIMIPLYNFGSYIRYKFFYAIDDGTGGQWFSRGTFRKVG